MKKLLLCCVISFISFSSQAQISDDSTNAKIVNATVDSLLYGRRGFDKHTDVSGASIGVFYKGKDYFFSYGYADKEIKTLVDTATIYEIGSNTKVFTALLLANEISKETIRIDDHVDKYFETNPAIQNKIRVIDLATFTSGLPTLHDSESLAPLEQIDSLYPLDVVDSSYIVGLLSKTTHLTDYGKYAYSNASFGLLGYLLGKVNNTTYEHLLTNELLRPLQLNHTTCLLDTNNIHMSKGYADGERAPYGVFTGLMAAGSLKSTVTDMMRFLKYEKGVGSPLRNAIEISQRIYTTNDDPELNTPVDIAMGWHVTKIDHDVIYVMRGDTYGYSSIMFFDKNRELGGIVLLNSANSDIASSSLVRILSPIIESSADYKQRFEQPEKNLSDKVLQSYTGSYTLMPGVLIDVTTQKGSMYVQITGQPKGKVIAVSDNLFVSKANKAEFEFVKDNEGNVTKLVLYQRGQTISAMKK